MREAEFHDLSDELAAAAPVLAQPPPPIEGCAALMETVTSRCPISYGRQRVRLSPEAGLILKTPARNAYLGRSALRRFLRCARLLRLRLKLPRF